VQQSADSSTSANSAAVNPSAIPNNVMPSASRWSEHLGQVPPPALGRRCTHSPEAGFKLLAFVHGTRSMNQKKAARSWLIGAYARTSAPTKAGW